MLGIHCLPYTWLRETIWILDYLDSTSFEAPQTKYEARLCISNLHHLSPRANHLNHSLLVGTNALEDDVSGCRYLLMGTADVC